MNFQTFFLQASGLRQDEQPHSWQTALASAEGSDECRDRLIRVPTGFGKTLGIFSAWFWHRILRNDDRWPRRLVWCLPMRVLVEQIEVEIRASLDRLGALRNGNANPADKVGVHALMGGADEGDWRSYPERCAVLIGTQDMLISRALNRGYASARARWPMEFGLLNQDCLWVMDEVQLMDVGLATSAQLQQFRNDDQGKSPRPCRTWWMSATLQAGWLGKSPDTTDMAAVLEKSTLRIAAGERTGTLWRDVIKPCTVESFKDTKALAKRIAESHNSGASGPTLAVVNRVKLAVDLAELLRAEANKKNSALKSTDIRLIHSRFRPAERARWREDFLNREACKPGTNRIIVATQVVEAGVDVSAGILFSELAPWASLVQRFGRCARWGGSASVIVADFGDNAAAPYTAEGLAASRDALGNLPDVSPLHLEQFEEDHPELLARLYPYAPRHLLLRRELDDLFDTSPDLSGADVDISRFIRSGDERDVQVFWADIAPKTAPPSSLKASRDQLCAVPFVKARDWLCGNESSTTKAPRLKKGMRAWVWDWLDGHWRMAERRDIYPGVTVLVDSQCGGYDIEKGWAPDSDKAVPLVGESDVGRTIDVACWRMDKQGQLCATARKSRCRDRAEEADSAEDDESLSLAEWQTIAFHGRETGRIAVEIAQVLAPDRKALFGLAGRWHDAGKAHPAFSASIRHAHRPDRHDLAKAPDAAWPCWSGNLYRISDTERRAGFRHELASTLALFAVLQRHDPDHAVLRGPYKGLLATLHPNLPKAIATAPPTPLEEEILALDRPSFDLLAWLVCTHHGKVRMAWHASPADQKSGDRQLRIRGVRDGDALPSLLLADAKGEFLELPASAMDLSPAAAGLNPRTGPGWTERVLGLLQTYGPFTLAYMEALMRAADIRASRDATLADPLLTAHNASHGLENRDPRVAPTPAGGADGAAAGACAGANVAEHDVRARAGESGLAEGSTRPRDATRRFDTAQGRLSYSELAERLAEPLLRIDERIRAGGYAGQAFDQHLLLRFHAELSSALFPDEAGRYRQKNVQVGAHEPPAPHLVPGRMVDYVRDLDERMQHLSAEPDDRWLETLAHAEGELLSIHPFPDLNGRISRLWLTELLRRLGLPPVDIVPTDAAFRERYLSALAAADQRDWRPLMALWRERFERPGEQP